MRASATKVKEKAATIAVALERNFGRPVPPRSGGSNALYELILTVLSQNTNDVNRDRAMTSLMEKFPTWEKIVRADRRSVESAIRVGGLAAQKSARIQNILKWVKTRFGDYSLDALKDMPTAEARKLLLSQKGIGPKTASIVLLFSFGRPAFPVDTHIHRVTTRLGLIGKKTTAEAAHGILGGIFEEKEYFSVHINLIEHGRKICKARKPLCGSCVLTELCPWPKNNPGRYI